MTSHPLFPRIGPFTWLVLQAASVVTSILLAFAIDAWWGQRAQAAEKNVLLGSIKEDLLGMRAWVIEERVYREAARDSAKVLLAAVAAGRYEDSKKTLDHRIGDLTWFSIAPNPSGSVEGLLRGGLLAAVEDETLRRNLAALPESAVGLTKIANQDYTTFTEVVSPFLARHTSLAQISNVSYSHGRPGDGLGANPEAIVPASAVVTDHSDLLRNQEFAGILVRKVWNESDLLYEIQDYDTVIDELVRLIDQELCAYFSTATTPRRTLARTRWGCAGGGGGGSGEAARGGRRPSGFGAAAAIDLTIVWSPTLLRTLSPARSKGGVVGFAAGGGGGGVGRGGVCETPPSAPDNRRISGSVNSRHVVVSS